MALILLRQNQRIPPRDPPSGPEESDAVMLSHGNDQTAESSLPAPALGRPAKISCPFDMDYYIHGYGQNDRGYSANV
jgi:hypothetical protein